MKTAFICRWLNEETDSARIRVVTVRGKSPAHLGIAGKAREAARLFAEDYFEESCNVRVLTAEARAEGVYAVVAVGVVNTRNYQVEVTEAPILTGRVST